MFRKSCWNIYHQLGYRNQLWLLWPERIPLEGYRAALRIEGKGWIVRDLALERKLDSFEVLNIGELRDGLFRTCTGMNQQQSFSILTVFPWRFKFLEERVGWVILPIHLPEGWDCKELGGSSWWMLGRQTLTDIHSCHETMVYFSGLPLPNISGLFSHR